MEILKWCSYKDCSGPEHGVMVRKDGILITVFDVCTNGENGKIIAYAEKPVDRKVISNIVNETTLGSSCFESTMEGIPEEEFQVEDGGEEVFCGTVEELYKDDRVDDICYAISYMVEMSPEAVHDEITNVYRTSKGKLILEMDDGTKFKLKVSLQQKY